MRHESFPPSEFLDVIDAAKPLRDALRATGKNAAQHLVLFVMAMLQNLPAEDRVELAEHILKSAKESLN